MRRVASCRASARRTAPPLRLVASVVAGVALWTLLATPQGVAAQPAQDVAPVPAPVAPAPAGAAAIPAAEVAARAAELDELLRAVRARAGETPAVAEVQERLALAEETWPRLAAEAMDRLQQPSPGAAISDLTQSWSDRARQAVGWNQVLAARVQQLAADLELLGQREASWQQTLEQAREESLPGEVEARIRASLGAIAETRELLKQRRNDLLTLQARIAARQEAVSALLQAVDAARVQRRDSLLSRDAQPLWSTSYRIAPAAVLRDLREAWSRDVADLQSLVGEGDVAVVNVALTYVALLGALVLLRRRARRHTAEDPSFEAAARVLARPGSAAFLVLILLLPALLPSAPRLVRLGTALVLVIPVLRLIAPLVSAGLRRAVFLLVAWYLFDWGRVVFEPVPAVARLLLLVESSASAAVLAWLLLPARLARVGPVTPWLRALGVAVRIGLALLSIAVLANLAGNLSLAQVLTEGTLFAAYVAVVLYGSGRVLYGIWGVLLHIRPLDRLRGVQRYERLLRRRGLRSIEIGLALLWLFAVLQRFDIGDAVFEAVRSALAASWPLGDVELTLGDLFAFGLTIWLALLLSRFVRFVLDEDVLPRTSLPRGVPYAISSSVNYVILLLGFVLAVSAAGFDMSRFALIVGALGVGIGIGLQDVVNNFVSGLILLFERPVKTGDIVDLGTLSGEVRRIGMRSSTVRTWGGAEVIVPNSKLVSETVINWTLSDRLRRMEISIGVAYGTEPQRVLDLLLEVAKAHPGVLADPEPLALFLAHGESSLDFELRVWVPFDTSLRVRSELTVAVNHALRDAGIEIPFPQRDLHVRSIDPGIQGLLPRGDRS